MVLRKGISRTESLRPPRVPEHGTPQGERDARREWYFLKSFSKRLPGFYPHTHMGHTCDPATGLAARLRW
jgi:hypothetical protein